MFTKQPKATLFTHIDLKIPQSVQKPERILAFDLDDTLFDYEESVNKKKVCLKNEEKLRQVLDHAKKNHIKLVIITARTAAHQGECDDYTSLQGVLKALGKVYFDDIYFTNHTPKAHVLNELRGRFFPEEYYCAELICLVDDKEENFDADFGMVYIDEENAYEYIKNFIDGTNPQTYCMELSDDDMEYELESKKENLYNTPDNNEKFLNAGKEFYTSSFSFFIPEAKKITLVPYETSSIIGPKVAIQTSEGSAFKMCIR